MESPRVRSLVSCTEGSEVKLRALYIKPECPCQRQKSLVGEVVQTEDANWTFSGETDASHPSSFLFNSAGKPVGCYHSHPVNPCKSSVKLFQPQPELRHANLHGCFLLSLTPPLINHTHHAQLLLMYLDYNLLDISFSNLGSSKLFCTGTTL